MWIEVMAAELLLLCDNGILSPRQIVFNSPSPKFSLSNDITTGQNVFQITSFKNVI